MKKFAFFLLIGLIFVSGCVQTVTDNTKNQVHNNIPSAAYNACTSSCKNARDSGEDMSKGPCLLDPIPVEPEWVCDIAHSPRQDVDNVPENQCHSYRDGQAKHFIELTPECMLIRAI
ncbi:MAG: hypothetical protein QXN71_01790 [Candidatus Aenigmatarchaeota archaeon]